jgi:hypothetical protein
MSIQDIADPIERFIAFVIEREAIRQRRAEGKPWPWTDNEILQSYRFTNVHREDDKVSRHYQNLIRSNYGDHPFILPATVLYRWFNRISTCEAFLCQSELSSDTSTFEDYMYKHDIGILELCLDNIPPPHVTGAFIITGKPGYPKGKGVLQYFDHWCRIKPWEETWQMWQEDPPTLAEMYDWLGSDGLGSFMLGQFVADLKYLPFMLNAPDWWTWAAPGPGSERGLNVIFGHPMGTPWAKGQWRKDLQQLNIKVAPQFEKAGIGRLHNQDLQNCLCEYSKFTKVQQGVGRPRQVYRRPDV